ncbi:MAG: hypothetical protein AB7J35_17295 [Dehalococcoidia bacterium]
MSELTVVGHVELDESAVPYGGQPTWAIWCDVLVDGVSAGHVKDDIGCLAGLVATAEAGGVARLFNCACGNFGCGGYYEGVSVQVQSDGSTRWRDLDRPEAPEIVFQTAQVRAAIEICVSGLRERLSPLRGHPIEFRCFDDAEVFGLDGHLIGLPVELQEEFEPEGWFDRRPDLFELWYPSYALHWREWIVESAKEPSEKARAVRLRELMHESIQRAADWKSRQRS